MKNKTDAELQQILWETLGKIDSGELTSKEVRAITREAGKENKRRDAILKDINKQLKSPNITPDELAAITKRFETLTQPAISRKLYK